MRELLARLTEEIADFTEGLRDVRIVPDVTPSGIRQHLAELYGDFAEPMSPDALLVDVAGMMRRWNVHVTHPRYFGLFNPSVQPVSIAADALVAAYNPQLAAWSHAPAANETERHTLRYLARQLGLDPDATAACFTTGGAEANQSAVLAALTHRLPEYPERGLAVAAAPPVIYVSKECHHSFEKIAHAVGLGREAVRYVSVDTALRLDPDALSEHVSRDRAAGYLPLLVAATAGTTSAGVIDPLPELAALCRAEDIWFHVDAAWGGAACFSPVLKPALAGIERADSITWDAHKWLSVPMGAGMFFCVHPDTVARTFEVRTPYMPRPTEDTADPYTTTIQWSRRHIGLKLFMALAMLGADGYRDTIEHQARMGDRLREELRRRDWQIVNETPLPLVCFTHPTITEDGPTPVDVVHHLQRENLWISVVHLTDRGPALRACITSYLTQAEDVEALAATATTIVTKTEA